MRGSGGPVLATGEPQVLRRVPGAAVSGIAAEGVLPNVDSREPAVAGEKAAERSGMDKGDRVSKTGKEGRAALRLCNLVAQSPAAAEKGIQAGGREGIDRAGNRTVGNYLLQAVPKSDAGH